MKSRQSIVRSVLGILALSGYAAADQPVHCYEDLVVGDWEFEITERATLPDLFKSEEVCSHELPNKLQIIEDDYSFEFADQTYILSVTLDKNNRCSASVRGQRLASCHWTMMYDQAMLINLPEDNIMANFRYNVHTSKSWSALQTGDYDEFKSVCSETMAGVQRNKMNGKFQCL